MRVVQATPYITAQQGGPSVVVPLLARELYAQQVCVEIVTQVWPEDKHPKELQGIICHSALTWDRSGFGYSPQLKKLMRQTVMQNDVLHTHGLWMYMNYLSPGIIGTLKQPYIITPHGMLEPWALAHSAWKKKLMRLLFEDKSMKNASCIHALCYPEANNIRALGFETPIAVIPNGVDLQAYTILPERESFAQDFPHLQGQKLILFLARIHPKKGLLHLIKAWSQLAAQFPDWHLAIAGPDEVGHQAVLKQAVESFDIARQTSFVGMLAGADKLAAFSAADLFVLPSFSEGFSIAVLEAMACSLPVLLTPQCNFPEAVAANAAIEVEPNAESTREGLEVLLKMTDQQRAEMGARGYRLVGEKYSWEHVAKNMIEVYRWCLDSGDPPATVRLA